NTSGDVQLAANLLTNGTIRVGGSVHITNNQIGVDNTNSDFYINNFAAGTGNVVIGKPSVGVVQVMNKLKVGPQTVIGSNPHANAILQVSGKVACRELVVLQVNQWA